MPFLLADDLTGAAEVAAICFESGNRAFVYDWDSPFWKEPSGNSSDFHVLNTDSRMLSPDEARDRLYRLALDLKPRALCYKKIDSLLRGPVLSEIEGLLENTGSIRALLIPQNPSMRRTISSGEYRVGGSPLDQTELIRDPAFPIHTSKVDMLLGMGFTTLASPSPLTGQGIFLGEAETHDEIKSWASCLDSQTLPVGGSDFFQALLKPHRTPPPTTEIPPVGLFLSGSTSSQSERFFASNRYSRLAALTIDQLNQILGGNADLRTPDSLPPAICSNELPPTFDFISTAARIIQVLQPRHFYVEGGSTAARLLKKLECHYLEVQRVWGKGTVTLRTPGPPHSQRWISTKPSAFPWPEGFPFASTPGT